MAPLSQPSPPKGGEGFSAPFAFVEKQKGAMRLVAVDPHALALGIVPGLSLADARARVPELEAIDYDPQADKTWLERIADGCDRYTPMVAIDPPDGLLLDISGCAHLFGGEQALVDDIQTRLDRLGMTVRIACAATPDAAHALARHGGKEDGIGALPVSALRLSSEETVALRRAGLKRIGDLTARASAPLAARFGESAPELLARLAGGRDIRITPRRPEPALVVERRFAEPIGHVDAALAAIEYLARQAAQRMQQAWRGGRRFEVLLFRTDGLVRRLRIETSLPNRDVPLLMRLFRERIEALDDPIDPGFGFDLVRLAVPVFEDLAPVQLPLDGGSIAEGEMAALIDRLSTRLGRGRVRRLAARDTHCPEQAVLAFPAVEAAPDTHWPAPEPGEPPLRPIHLFDPPQRIEVMAQVPDGPPLRFRWRHVLHEVARHEGPERIGALWWRRADNKGLTRDYYRIEDLAGHRFWIFRHGLYGAEAINPDWYMHGLFA
nr:DNA polymerase Y family protein [Sphingomonas sp. YR710]